MNTNRAGLAVLLIGASALFLLRDSRAGEPLAGFSAAPPHSPITPPDVIPHVAPELKRGLKDAARGVQAGPDLPRPTRELIRAQEEFAEAAMRLHNQLGEGAAFSTAYSELKRKHFGGTQ